MRFFLIFVPRDPVEARGLRNSKKVTAPQERRLGLALEAPPCRRKLLKSLLNRWLDLSGAQLRMVEENQRLVMTFLPALESGWLFTSIATQIAFQAAGARRLLTCSNCGQPYVPKHLPRGKGTNTYCLKCGRKAALRDAQKRWRERKRKKREAAASKTRSARKRSASTRK